MKKDKTADNMSFLDHLEALRWHLVRSFIAILIFAIIIFSFQKQVYDSFLLAHLEGDFVTYQWFCEAFSQIGIQSNFCQLSFDQKLQSLSLTQQLMNVIWTSILLGFALSFPYTIWELWRFIMPGLNKNEIKKSRFFLIVSSLLFFAGILFSYYVITPMSVYFFYNYSITDTIQNNFTFDSYISLVTNTILGVAVVFELPVLIYFLSQLGLITSDFLKTYRRHALVVVLLLAAIITPPDIASQIIVAIPILILYEIGILVSKRVEKRIQNKAS